MKQTTLLKLTPMALALSLLLSACTKQVPYKEVYKEDVIAKSSIDSNAEYIYVASSDLSNHESLDAAGARPYWQGSENIVKFRFTEGALEAYAIEKEDRLKSNAMNERVIMRIPVDYLEYRCAEDKYGKCKNEEEDNKELKWSQKSNFKPKFQDTKFVATNLLPVEMDKVFGESCYTEVSSEFMNYELTADSLNMQFKKVFNANMECLSKRGARVTSIASTQTQIVYHYSFTKLNKLATPNYKAIDYPRPDENEFGFFTTENKKYDLDYTRSESLDKQFLNRWSPERKEVVYYLTDNFDKPEFKAVKKATQIAFDRVNAGLDAAKLNFRLVLSDAKGKSPGDVRNSMIVLVEDPIASGPLGYGPTATNPRTGEILSARTVMYYGNFLGQIRYTYDEVVRELRHQAKKKTESNQGQVTPQASPSADIALNSKIQEQLRYLNVTKPAYFAAKKLSDIDKNSIAKDVKQMAITSRKESLTGLTRDQFQKTMQQSSKVLGDDILSAMSKYCNYPAELFPFDEAVANGLKGKLGQDLKFWKDLSDTERQEVIALIMPEVWVPTLVHELGHNLGLRHNFGGSEDKANFYSKEELAKMNVRHEIPYSSVMDYGYSELNLLPTLGKYDIAALKFAYNRTIEDKDGKELSITSTLKNLKTENAGLETKKYSYCSDEHVDVNPNCKRFDKGTNMVEIVDFLIKTYYDMYDRRNFRNGAESFSITDDARYLNARKANFNYIRAFMERYKSIRHRFAIAEDDKAWTENPFLKEVKEAALKSGRFFLEVLSTPDVMCAIAKTDKPSEIVQLQSLSSISGEAMNCFTDINLNKGFVMAGQTGKLFNSKKSSKSENSYADQIDARGIYLDKIAAVRALFGRKTGNTIYDKYEDNYLDMAELRQEILTTVQGLLIGQAVSDLTFKDADGDEFTIPNVSYSLLSGSEEKNPTHWMQGNDLQNLGIGNTNMSFQEFLIKSFIRNASMGSAHSYETTLTELFSVRRTNQSYVLNEDAQKNTVDVNNVRYTVLENNSFGRNLILNIQMAKALEKTAPEKLLEIYNKRVPLKGNPITEPSGDDTVDALNQMPMAYLAGAIRGTLPPSKRLEFLLSILPDVN